ncbi:MAG: sialate O-acetylesterase, partial [Kiritimatiellales bacterium]
IERFLSPSGVAAVPELSGMSQQQESGALGGFYDIYNAMIAPVIPYAIRGVIWYQGEANGNGGNIYQFQMQALLRGWRKEWNIENLPFYYVQLANYGVAANWPDVREAQLRALSEPNSGMAVVIDVGETDNIHPANKMDIGRRLAQWALAKDLQYDVPYSGPLFHRATIEDGRIRVIFDFADQGLMIGQKNSTNAVVQIEAPLENFEIAGTNRVFVPAIAVLDQNTVLVSSQSVLSPMYVRYCYSGDPAGGNKLYNTEGFPASPFRTDESYRLDVKSGSGTTTTVMTGARVAITATAASAGYVFDRWIGAGSAIANPNAATTTITMPSHALYVSATYRVESDSTFQLTVNNGTGDGAAQAGAIINVEAAAPLPGQQFGYWTGDTQTVENVRAACTTLRMPAQNIQITSVYQVIDSVGDGISGAWRAMYFGGDGSITNSHSAANADDDMDGMSNLQEYLTGTSPVDAGSVLAIFGQVKNSNITLNFKGVSNHRYQIQSKEYLQEPAWKTLYYNIAGNNSVIHFEFDTSSVSSRFYRVQMIAD